MHATLKIEKIILALICTTFFIGIWHALPLTTVIGDEAIFVGGVLRTMQNYAVMPLANEVPYGTLTYFINYILTAIVLVILFPFFGWNINSLKLFLTQSHSYIYLIPRTLSAVLSIVSLVVMYKILRREINDVKTRIFLILLLYTNVLLTAVSHTGKQWVLSTLLVTISFYFLSKAIGNNTPASTKQNVVLGIIFSFLSIGNFPLNIFSLIIIPILLYVFYDDREIRSVVLKATSAGVLILLLILLTNLSGNKGLFINIFTGWRPIDKITSDDVGIVRSFFSMAWKACSLFLLPLLVLLIVSFKSKIKNKKIFYISLIYFVAYFATITIVATWAALTPDGFLRYLAPLGFFIIPMISSFDIKMNSFYYSIGAVSVIYFIFSLYLISSPTTYNEARSWTIKNLNKPNTTIVNKVGVLEMPKNKNSYLLNEKQQCLSRCINTIENDLNKQYLFLVIDRENIANWSKSTTTDDSLYYVYNSKQDSTALQLVSSFENGIGDDKIFYHPDHRLGHYLYPNFFKLRRLGENIYIYRGN